MIRHPGEGRDCLGRCYLQVVGLERRCDRYRLMLVTCAKPVIPAKRAERVIGGAGPQGERLGASQARIQRFTLAIISRPCGNTGLRKGQEQRLSQRVSGDHATAEVASGAADMAFAGMTGPWRNLLGDSGQKKAPG
jgi:hypothetical protein